MPLALRGGEVRRSRERCHAIGLLRGDCEVHRHTDSLYCYYHDKVQRGLLEPTARVYPVFPLPAEGYVLAEGYKHPGYDLVDGEMMLA